MSHRVGAVVIAVAIGGGLLLAILLSEGPPAPLRAGRQAPPFSLSGIDQEAEVALEDFRGRVLLINFWATWCKPCEDEMPAMERLYRQFRDSGFGLVAISVDEDKEEVASFRRRLRLTFPILLDPRRRVADAYQTYRFPESFLVDPEGMILARYIGPREWDAAAYVDRIRRLLESRAAGPTGG